MATSKPVTQAVTKTIDKVVFMSADDSLKAVVLCVGNAANATLRLIAQMTVHLCVRTYHHDETQRRDFTKTKEELLSAFKEYAELKRGRPFEHAWVSRLMACSIAMGRSLVKDYDKKGVQPGSPLSNLLRSKTPATAQEHVMTFIMAKTKGNSAFTALERSLAPATKPAPAARPGAGSNAVKPSTDTAPRIAAALDGDKGAEIFNAVKGNAKAKAIKIADKVGQSNVDHLAFILRSLTFLSKVEDLVGVSEAALNLAKEIQAKANEGKRKGRKAQDNETSGGTPQSAVAEAAVG